MTAAAMIIGMLPMALGLGEGGEQNAPLGRAVIGGLLGATADHAVHCPGHLFASAHARLPANQELRLRQEEIGRGGEASRRPRRQRLFGPV